VKEGLIAKKACLRQASVTKKTTKRGLCGSHKKDRASHEERMVGIFCSWWLTCGAACNKLSGEA